MRVLHVDLGREMRGGQWQVLRLLEQRRDAGDVLLVPEAAPLAGEARRRGLPVQPLTPAGLWRESRRAALVHAHDARAHTWAAALAGCLFVVSRRVAFPVRRSLLSRWKYRQAGHYLAVSGFVAGRLREAGVPDERVTVVYDGVPMPDAPARGDRVVALAFGDPRKGTALLQEAARRAGVAIEWTTDLAASLPHARLFVYLTEEEGLGSAALLAMAHGVPVLASDIGGLPEVVRDGETGQLTANDPDLVAGHLRHLLGQPELLSRWGLAAREWVQDRFTVQSMARATEEVYQKVCG